MVNPEVIPQNKYYFLQGGGELGELTRSYDWASTSLGSPESWPQSLRTSISTVLNSAFPMLLFWGDDMVCFYNDAFRPSLGIEGRHPAVGQRGPDMWEDIWDFVGPLLEGVKATGDPVYFENQLVPFYRDGKMDDIYWTFSYSAVYNEAGKIDGVMVVCNETTELVVANKKLKSSEQRFHQLVSEATMGILVVTGETLKMDILNDAYARIVGRTVEELQGKELFKEIPEEEAHFRPIIEHVLHTAEPIHLYDQSYFVNVGERKIEGYLNIVYQPYKDEDVTGVMILCHDVTEQVIAKKKLEESEQRFRSVIEAAPMPIGIMTGKEMTVAFANQSIKEAWGKGNNVEGMTFSQILPELEGKGFYESLDKVYTTGIAFHSRNERIELVVDGVLQPYYYNYSYSPLFDTEGNVYGVMNTAANVTDIEIARRKVEDSEQQVRSIIDSAPFPIAVYTGPEKTIAFANQTIIDVWGKGNDVVGKKYTEILPELDNQQIFEQVTGVYETGIPFHARNQRVDLVVDGKLQSFWFNYSFTPLFDAEGKVYGVMNTAAEVTDLNRAKQKVEESERNLRNIILQAPMATCIYRGEDNVIEIANNAMFEFWGVEGKDVLNKPLFEAMPDVGKQGYEEILAQVRSTGTTYFANEMIATLQRDGKPKDVFINFSLEPIRETDGSITGIMAVAIDVTPQVQARQAIEEVVSERTAELATANEYLQRSNAELEQFAYIASHDLQEPLRKVTTFTQLLEMSLGDISEQSRKYLDKINTSTERMAGLIRDVLHYSQLSTDERRSFTATDLNEVIGILRSDYELLIAQTGTSIICDELPVIEALPQQMSQLFSNLISNAIKFAKQGVAPEIIISSHKMNEEEVIASALPAGNAPYYKIEVRDNGIGFGQEHAEKIFNIFQRLHGKTEYKGTGIGLAMCKKIAMNHNGAISASSDLGSGAVFTLVLPEKHM